MKVVPHAWREPAAGRCVAPRAAANDPAPGTILPQNADLAALMAQDNALLATVQEQCRARGLYLVHNGREIKVAPYVEPGWRVIVENDLSR